MAVLQWNAWDSRNRQPPKQLHFAELLAPAVNPDASPPGSGPYLLTAAVPAWGAVIAAHSKASDEHISLQGNAEVNKFSTLCPYDCILFGWPGHIVILSIAHHLHFLVQFVGIVVIHGGFAAEVLPGEDPRAVDVTEDWSAIRIPLAKDYQDNYVIGVQRPVMQAS